jgi:hypothetical protein
MLLGLGLLGLIIWAAITFRTALVARPKGYGIIGYVIVRYVNT